VVTSFFVFNGIRTAIAKIKQMLLKKNVSEEFRVSYCCVKAKNGTHVELRHCVKGTSYCAFYYSDVILIVFCLLTSLRTNISRSLFLVSLYSEVTERAVDLGHLLNSESEFAFLSMQFRWHPSLDSSCGLLRNLYLVADLQIMKMSRTQYI
jgi:hypothetical protein